jgi:hypothetical protein
LYEQKGFVTQVYDAIRALERIIDEIREKYFESQQIEAFQNIILYLNEQLINVFFFIIGKKNLNCGFFEKRDK